MSTKNMAESLLAERDVDCRAYEAMGCHSVTYSDEHGCIQEIYRFRVWAPRATAVYVTGDFNGWSNASPMHRVGEEGIWTAEIDRGAFSSRGLYKYRIVTQNGEFLKADPYSIAFEMPPATASCAELLPDYPWRDGGWLRHRSRIKNNGADGPLTVYEVHLGSWKRSEKGGVLSFFIQRKFSCEHSESNRTSA